MDSIIAMLIIAADAARPSVAQTLVDACCESKVRLSSRSGSAARRSATHWTTARRKMRTAEHG